MDERDDAIRESARPAHVAPELCEWLFTLAAIAFLVLQSAVFHDPDFARGAGDRYQEAVELRVPVPPESAGSARVVEVCRRFGGWLPQAERESSVDRPGICAADSRHSIAAHAREDLDPSVAAGLVRAHDALAQSFALPVEDKLLQLRELENRVREARAETDVQGAVASLAGETRVYREAYGIGAIGGAGASAERSVPFECAWKFLDARYNAPAGADNAPAGAGESNPVFALVGMAALLDGDAVRATAAAFPGMQAKSDRWPDKDVDPACRAFASPKAAIRIGAEIVARARASDGNAAKSLASRELLANAHWIFALWAVLGLLLLQIGRRAANVGLFLTCAALIWSLAGWLTQVHIEWISDRSAQTAWLLRWGVKWPEAFQYLTAAAAVALLGFMAFSSYRRDEATRAPRRLPRQTPSSRVGYAGFVLFVGLGWWLLLDLSATGHYANRFHALYQQVYVFAAFVLLTVVPPLRFGLADRLGRAIGWFLLHSRFRGADHRRYLPWLMYAGAVAIVSLVTMMAHKGQTQLTSEIFRMWLVFGVSWYFFVRGESALALYAGGTKSGMHGLAFVWPLFFILCVPLFGLIVTDDFGPLFVMLYASSIFLGAALAFAYFDMSGYRPWLGGAMGTLIAGAWVYLITFALFSLPAPLARIAERLASVRSPFTATNDQLAIITWFQESAPAGGYGLGAVPWCGELATTSCRGVPRQIQSDYVFTALVGEFGKTAAVALVALLAVWLVRVVIHHSRATRGVVVLGSDLATQQAWLSWIAVCWVGLTLAQLAITVAGNLGWLPLTGITFPFASFGVWSLLANTFVLALAINLPRRAS